MTQAWWRCVVHTRRYKLSVQLAELLVGRFLPDLPATTTAPDVATADAHAQDTDGDTELACGENCGGGVERDEASALGVTQDLEFLNVTVAYSIWLLCCFVGVLWIKFSRYGYVGRLHG